MPSYNKNSNPSGGANNTGWTANSNPTTVTRVTGLSGPPRTTGLSLAYGSGAFSAAIGSPNIPNAAAGQIWSSVIWVRSTVTRTYRFYYFCRGVNNVTTAKDVSLTANTWTQVNYVGTLLSGTTSAFLDIDVPTSGTAGTLTVSSCRYDQINDANMSYFDGDSSNASWDGTQYNSTSTLNDSVAISGSDTATHIDSISVLMTDDLYDSISIRENTQLSSNTILSDPIIGTDSVSISTNISVSDSAIHSEQISIQYGTPIDLTDSAIHTDIAAISSSLSITDSALNTDQATINALLSLTDTATHTESTSLNLSGDIFNDTATHTDNVFLNTNTSLTDSATHTDNVTILFSALTNDVATHFEYATINSTRIVSDSATHFEQVTINVIVIDQITSNDTASSRTRVNLTDTQTITDLIARLKTGTIIREDQITYSSPIFTKPRNPFRVIAQDIFTREIFHWDVPIVDPELTFRKDSPNSFKGTLRGDIASLFDVSSQFIEDRTLLHCEEDGVIRQTTILMPFIDSNGEQIRQIEGIGFSDIPNRRFYLGAPVEFIYTDPMTIIRYIWAYIMVGQGVQDYIPVRIPANINTPVRLGTPKKNVNFQTSNGKNVDFDAGPYDLNYWEVSNLGTELDKLYKETPIEYTEQSIWNTTHTDTIQTINYGYPRIGAARNGAFFRDGENIKETIPEYVSSRYPRSVTVIGAGEGSSAIRATCNFVSGDIKRVPYDLVLESEDIQTYARAFAIAKAKLLSLYRSRYSIKSIRIDTTHPNAQLGTFAEGDDIPVETYIRNYGRVSDWHRITEYTYYPTLRDAELQISPSGSFPYGATLEVEK